MIGLIAAILVSAAPAAHPEPKPIGLKALAGHTIVTMDGGHSAYELKADGTATYQGIMGATGTGKWTVEGRVLVATGRGRGGPCGDADACEEDWSWSVRLTRPARSESGLLVVDEVRAKGKTERLVLECDAKKRCEDSGGVLVKVMPGHADRKLFDRTLAKLVKATPGLVVRGAAAKNPREVTELFWYPHGEASEASARDVAAAIEAIAGTVVPKEWTYSRTRYDVIVVVGRKPQS